MSTPKTVCDTQDTFNHAFRKAVKYVEKKETPKTWIEIVSLAILMIVIVFAVILASKVDTSERVIHYTLAIMFSPVYILAYLVGGVNRK